MRSLVERIWAYDASVWTGADEDRWLGWLDASSRVRPHVDELKAFAETASAQFESVVLLGMGGSSLAPEVLRRTFADESLHVLDTTHPQAIRRLERELDLDRTLFLVSSKSGSTIETRSQLEYFWERCQGRGPQFAAITDPGSELEQLANERGFVASFAGEAAVGGRYSALSMFGMVPAALLGVDLERFLGRAGETIEACRGDGDANPGLELGLRLGTGWKEGRDKVCVDDSPTGFGLWAEQLVAESTGKQGKGIVPAPGESPDGPDRQRGEVLLGDPYELGAEFYRWEFATAVAGHVLGINPFDQPDVQAAKDMTLQALAADLDVEPQGSLDDLLAQAGERDYVCVQAFIDPAREDELEPLLARAHETGCVVTHGLGPRYLHSTGQLHKGGPNTGLFVQVVDDTGEELPIPGRDFGFGRLIRAQAAGDLKALEMRGRRVIRLRLEDI